MQTGTALAANEGTPKQEDNQRLDMSMSTWIRCADSEGALARLLHWLHWSEAGDAGHGVGKQRKWLQEQKQVF